MSYSFNAGTDFFQRNANIPSSTNYTACGWARVTQSLAGADRLFFQINNAGAAAYHVIGYANASSDMRLLNHSGGVAIFPIVPPIGAWFFWAAQCQGTGGSDLIGYLSLLGSDKFDRATTTGTSFTSTQLWLGCEDTGVFWNGRVGPTKVFDAVLTFDQLRKEKNSLMPKAGKLNLWTPLRYSEHDISGLNRDWTINGTPVAKADDPPIPWDSDIIIPPSGQLFEPTGNIAWLRA